MIDIPDLDYHNREYVDHLPISWDEFNQDCDKLAEQITASGFMPEFIVGITRGGLTPAVILSQILKVPMYTLKVTLRDGVEEDCDHNCWMSEEAFGYGDMGCLENTPTNILIVDDINDSGATIAWIKKDWESSCLPNSAYWNEVWHNTVKFATLVDNSSSSQRVDYSARVIDKSKDNVWIDFPWER
jgi:hypoxanthine phosphoribosyltransferase